MIPRVANAILVVAHDCIIRLDAVQIRFNFIVVIHSTATDTTICSIYNSLMSLYFLAGSTEHQI